MKKVFLLFLIVSSGLNSSEIGKVLDERLFSQDIKIVQEAISEGADLNIENSLGNTPLMSSTVLGDRLGIAKLLIEAGANINAQSVFSNGLTALMKSIIQRKYAISKLLIDSKADLNIRDENGNTALMIAIAYNQIKAAKLLIHSGADFNIQDEDGNTALMIAARDNRLEMAELLIDLRSELNIKNKDGNTALMIAELRKNDEMVKLIKDKKNLQNKEPEFIKAAQNGEIKELVQFIEQGVNINAKDENGFTALMRAAQGSLDSDQAKRKLEIVKILLDKKADFTLKDYVMHFTTLRWAQESGNVQAENLLKAAGATL